MENVSEVDGMDSEQLRGLINELEYRNEKLLDETVTDSSGARPVSESVEFERLALSVDNIGWNPLGVPGGENPMRLNTVQRISETSQALSVVNPMVKRGLQIRSAYVWGHGVKVLPDGAAWVTPSIRRTLGTLQAQCEIDRTIAADGNLFFLVDPDRGRIQRIPLNQITGAVLMPGDPETRLYIKRTYTDFSTMLDVRFNASSIDQAAGRSIDRWYATDELEGPRERSIYGVDVDRRQTMVAIPFNRQFGWTWGVPDVLSVVFWTQAYKEFLENCATLTKAYARFAWKVVSSTKKGQKRTSSQMAEPPQRDPKTGDTSAVGGAVSLGANQDIQALQNARSVDFNAGRPLAALIAAGLEVPLTALTSDPSEGNRATAETLDEPTRLGMEMRQHMMGEIITRLRDALGVPVGAGEQAVEWPEISPEPLHRTIQAVDQAGRTGMLFPAEWRKLLLDAVEISASEQPPGRDDLPLAVQNDLQSSAQGDPPSRGDPELRDEPGQQPSANDMM